MQSNDRDRELVKTFNQPPPKIMTEAEERKYSLSRAVMAVCAGNAAIAGFESEISKELATGYREPTANSGMFIPSQVLQRDLNVATVGAGGYLTDTENIGFVELARPRSVLLTLGGTVIEGLTSNASIPRITGGITTTWLGTEIAAATETQPSIGQILLSPKAVSAYTEISRQLTLQMSLSADRFLKAEIVAAIGQAIDVAGIAGSGAEGQPLGVANVTGIGAADGSSLARADLLTMQANAGNSLSPFGGYVAPVATAELLAGRETVASTGNYLWSGNLYQGELAGYAAMASNNVPTGQLLFGGDWSTIVIASWGNAVEISINPYADFPAGIIGLSVIHNIDIAVRQPTAFSITDTVT